ncbi:uncharacterized protein [Littorina saxatilis]|uniref:uncharacterized protein isoform X2 n=1 Tax=Littorina saxatilis TaxID=31220 RepID=UPI0038B479CE
MCATSKTVMETKILAVFVLSCISSSVHAVTLTGCPAGNITDGSQMSLKCTGFFRSFTYSWAITTPSTGGPEKVFATCSAVSSCVITDTAYNITRVDTGLGSDQSFARFVINVTVHSNAIVRCFRSTDTSSSGGETCTLINIIAAPTTLAPTTTTILTSSSPQGQQPGVGGGSGKGLTSSSPQATTVNSEGQEASTKGQDKTQAASSSGLGIGIGIASLLAIIAGCAAVLFFRKKSTAPPDEKDKTPAEPVNPPQISEHETDNSGSGELAAEDEPSGSHSAAENEDDD